MTEDESVPTEGERIADEFMRWQPDEDDYHTVRDKLADLIDKALEEARLDERDG